MLFQVDEGLGTELFKGYALPVVLQAFGSGSQKCASSPSGL